eukprot:TRINITY_DN2326_c0_g1_i5.p9 TRINITY_DN2326_c0_g1~~TRINITY_DN2326_c0_g1_i5.p9  ORF type:complete len:102 (-),score=1.45 TRINITY_DN2326_c0_g1_i5:280-585(-)
MEAMVWLISQLQQYFPSLCVSVQVLISTYIVIVNRSYVVYQILEGRFFSQNILRRQKLTSNFLFIIPKQSQNQLLFLIFQIINVTSLGGLIIRGGQVVIYY